MHLSTIPARLIARVAVYPLLLLKTMACALFCTPRALCWFRAISQVVRATNPDTSVSNILVATMFPCAIRCRWRLRNYVHREWQRQVKQKCDKELFDARQYFI